MIDTTTQSFNHCGGAAAAASVTVGATSGSTLIGRSHHLNSDQDRYQAQLVRQQHQLDSYSSTVHLHHQQQQHQLTELGSIGEQRLAKYCNSSPEEQLTCASSSSSAAARFGGSHGKLTKPDLNQDHSDQNRQQFYYNNLHESGYHQSSCWTHNNNHSTWPNASDDCKTGNNQQFRSAISPPEQPQWQLELQQQQQQQQQQQEPTSADREDTVESFGAKQQLDNSYQSARGGFSPKSGLLYHQRAARGECTPTTVAASAPNEPITYAESCGSSSGSTKDKPPPGNEFNQLRILEMRKEKSRDAARSRRSKENHEFYELAKLLPLPAAITSQLDFLDKASIIRLTISFLKLRQFSVNGHPPWAPDFATLGSVNPYSSQSSTVYAPAPDHQQQSIVISPAQTPSSSHRLAHNQSYGSSVSSLSAATPSAANAPAPNPADPYRGCASVGSSGGNQQQTGPAPVAGDCQQDRSAFVLANSSQTRHSSSSTNYQHKNATSLFDVHQGTHILQSLDGFAFAIGRDGRFLYISETVSMYLGLSQVEMTGSSVFDYTHQQDHEELAQHLGIENPSKDNNNNNHNNSACDATVCVTNTRPASVHSQYSAASNETLIDDYVNHQPPTGGPLRKRPKTGGNNNSSTTTSRGAYGRHTAKRAPANRQLLNLGPHSGKAPIKIESNTSDNATCLADEQSLASREAQDGGSNGSKTEPDNGLQGTREDPLVRQFCIRMKSTLTKRGCQHFKSSGYRVVHVVAHLRSYQSNDHGHLMDPLDEPLLLAANSAKPTKRRGPKCSSSAISGGAKDATGTNKQEPSSAKNEPGPELASADERPLGGAKIIGMVAVAIALPPPSINELRLESDTFVLRLGLDLKITHIEPRITELLQYPVELMAGRNLYSLIHPADAYQVQKCHKDLLAKGQMMSGYYRLLARDGGYIWIQTCATLICNNTTSTSSNSGAQLAAQQGPHLAPSPASASGLLYNPMTPSNGVDLQQQQQQVQPKLPGYLAPSLMGGSKQLLPSPGTSSHISSNYDSSDQDQCVIFVNYMITNVIETDQMLDICQGQDFSPIGSFTGISANTSAGNNGNGNILYTSPSSTCSSPCMSSLKPINNNNTLPDANSYVQLTGPTSANTMPTTIGGGHRRQHVSKDMKSSSNGRRATIAHKAASKSNYLSSEENGAYGDLVLDQRQNKLGDNQHPSIQQQQQQHQNEANEIPSEPADIYGSYNSTPGSVNLALNNGNNNNNKQVQSVSDHSHWPSGVGSLQQPLNDHHNHNQQQQQHHHLSHHRAPEQGPTTAMGYGQAGQVSDHYSGMDRSSIYKAAFGLNVGAAAATNYGAPTHNQTHHHHQQAGGSQLYSAPSGQVVAYGSTATAAAAATGAPAVCGSWDSAAAVAAVAAASNLAVNHHHHHVAGATNPYAHLEPHHHHQAAAAAAAAAAAHSLNPSSNHHHHHTSAGNYYNYYGYYGNKFI